MAGHSKWANIKHKKARVDKLRGKAWSKCSKALMVAAKHGGPDPAANLSLRYAIDEARAANMPKDTIERAIAKGAGLGSEGADFEDIRYEGYGIGGVAILVDCLTDNRQRTAPEIRSAFAKAGGNLGTTGSVAFMFDLKGIITIEGAEDQEDAIMTAALEAGAEDVEFADGLWTISTPADSVAQVSDALEASGLTVASGTREMVPNVNVEVAGDAVAQNIKLLNALEDLDDVQKVYSNMDASAEDLAAAMD
ncbi:MAG: YebC/PmpR family DNA-binding transcriptional regulator [Phycisphaerales bacterium]|nr:YebC/PmpR family DNA-binding transcriptional regulator [Phycisphaerales bacterium]